jgi:hypothetical protein
LSGGRKAQGVRATACQLQQLEDARGKSMSDMSEYVWSKDQGVYFVSHHHLQAEASADHPISRPTCKIL